MLDPQDEIFDRKLATHLVSLYYKTEDERQQESLVSCQKSCVKTCPSRCGCAFRGAREGDVG